MQRLIDADAWDSELMSYGFGQAIIGRKIKYTVGEVRSALAKQPTVDAVEVVRCKNCKKWETINCPFARDFVKWDGFKYCAWGEREEDVSN